MTVVVPLEVRFARTPDGAIWTQTPFHHEMFRRGLLHIFEEVRLVARTEAVGRVSEGWRRVDGDCVSVARVPHYVGPLQYARRFAEVSAAVRLAVGPRDAVMTRVPSPIATHVLQCVAPSRPYAVQVVGDPVDSFAPGAIRHPLRPLIRQWFCRRMRRQCATAAAAAYVTREALQRRYPCPGHSVSFSDVQISPAALAPAPRVIRATPRPQTLITVGSLENFHKAPEVQLHALAACVRRGLDLQLRIVGDGRYRPGLESLARGLGLGGRVTFVGQLSAGTAVRDELDGADVFLLPSKAEGLPRAMIEAMARGLPCIGSTVGGIPELLTPEDLVPPSDAAALARKIEDIVRDPARMARMSCRNLSTAQDYLEAPLMGRRHAFYAHIREITERWLAR